MVKVEMSSAKLGSFCTICFQSGDNVFTMSGNDINYYETILSKSPFQHLHRKICVYCREILKKTVKFIQLCHASNTYLNNTTQTQIKYNPPTNTCYNLQKSTTIIHINNESKNEEYNADDIFNDAEFSDDEIPLAELKDSCDKDGLIRDKKTIKVKEMADDQPNDSNKKRRTWVTAKGSQREGFNSKMVQETEQYIVLKLTKEEVIKEMREKSQSIDYLKYTFKCESCVKGFNYEDVLQNHMQKHLKKPGSLKCEICNQHCPSAVSLRGHIKSHTTRYKCKVCEVTRLSRQHLLEHYGNKHGGGVREYNCMQCQYTTDKRTVIQRHVRSHKSDRHTCHRCGNSYSTLMALRVHMKRHDSSARVICPQCGRKFITASILQKHIIHVHERGDYYCVECDVKFQCAYNLNLHFKRAKRHRDETSYRYKCPTCPQRFVYKSELESHASRHGDEQTVSCAHCDKTFTTKHGLRTHSRRAHGQIKSKNKMHDQTSNEV